MKFFLNSSFLFLILLQTLDAKAWEGMPMPELRVEGRYLKDSHGHIVNLHGFAQTYSPWFNERGTKWNNYDVKGCLKYNHGIIDRLSSAGWKMNFVRMHMDPYWSSTPGCTGRYEGEECFNETRFRKYLDEVFVPMAEYAVSKGLYVVMRPPGVCPEKIEIGGVYHKYLIKVWGIVSKHPALNSNPHIMFELANEPINILGTDGTYGAGTQGHFDNLKTYFQEITDTIRNSAGNILWIPGLGYQSLYSGYAVNPIEGENIGYAVHVYPGWFNSGSGYEAFRKGWEQQVQPVADFAPVMVTEMDWAPERHNMSWGKGITGEAGGEGFGANFKKIADDCGNVSWLIFTEPHLLAEFGNPGAPAHIVDFLTDPEACPWPVYHWYRKYAEAYDFKGVSDDYLTVSELYVEGGNTISVITNSSKSVRINAVFADGHIENVSSVSEISVKGSDVINFVRGRVFAIKDGQAEVEATYTDKKGNQKQVTFQVNATTFPLTKELFNPKIWENGTFDEKTRTLHTGPWGFGGWLYNGIDLSGYKYLVARLGSNNNASVDFRIFDGASYWGAPAIFPFGSKREVVVNLKTARKNNGSSLNVQHIYIVGFWSNGSNPFVIDTVFLTNSSKYDPPAIHVKNDQGNEITSMEVFRYQMGAGPSGKQKLMVSGSNLTGNMNIIASTGFEISKDTLVGFSSNFILYAKDGVVEETSVYVRMKAGLPVGNVPGNLVLSSPGASNKTVSLSGLVDPSTSIHDFNASGVTVMSVHYFTLSGQKVNSIVNKTGIFIEKKILSNGKVRTTKIHKNY